MPKMKVTFNGLGGELDSTVCTHDTDELVQQAAALAAVKMISEAGELHEGDSIVISLINEKDDEDEEEIGF